MVEHDKTGSKNECQVEWLNQTVMGKVFKEGIMGLKMRNNGGGQE
jgi:hypothetical protein